MVCKRYPALYSLEERHGVELVNAYKTKDSARLFTNYIAQHQRNGFMATLCKAHFFSCLMDGSMDAGNVEDEILSFCIVSKMIKAKKCFFSVQVPKKADADGLIDCLGSVLQELEYLMCSTRAVFWKQLLNQFLLVEVLMVSL